MLGMTEVMNERAMRIENLEHRFIPLPIATCVCDERFDAAEECFLSRLAFYGGVRFARW